MPVGWSSLHERLLLVLLLPDYYAEAGTIWSAVDHLYDFASWPSVYLGRQLLCAAFTCLGAQLLMHAGTLCGVLYIKRTAGRATAAAISA